MSWRPSASRTRGQKINRALNREIVFIERSMRGMGGVVNRPRRGAKTENQCTHELARMFSVGWRCGDAATDNDVRVGESGHGAAGHPRRTQVGEPTLR